MARNGDRGTEAESEDRDQSGGELSLEASNGFTSTEREAREARRQGRLAQIKARVSFGNGGGASTVEDSEEAKGEIEPGQKERGAAVKPSPLLHDAPMPLTPQIDFADLKRQILQQGIKNIFRPNQLGSMKHLILNYDPSSADYLLQAVAAVCFLHLYIDAKKTKQETLDLLYVPALRQQAQVICDRFYVENNIEQEQQHGPADEVVAGIAETRAWLEADGSFNLYPTSWLELAPIQAIVTRVAKLDFHGSTADAELSGHRVMIYLMTTEAYEKRDGPEKRALVNIAILRLAHYRGSRPAEYDKAHRASMCMLLKAFARYLGGMVVDDDALLALTVTISKTLDWYSADGEVTIPNQLLIPGRNIVTAWGYFNTFDYASIEELIMSDCSMVTIQMTMQAYTRAQGSDIHMLAYAAALRLEHGVGDTKEQYLIFKSYIKDFKDNSQLVRSTEFANLLRDLVSGRLVPGAIRDIFMAQGGEKRKACFIALSCVAVLGDKDLVPNHKELVFIYRRVNKAYQLDPVAEIIVTAVKAANYSSQAYCESSLDEVLTLDTFDGSSIFGKLCIARAALFRLMRVRLGAKQWTASQCQDYCFIILKSTIAQANLVKSVLSWFEEGRLVDYPQQWLESASVLEIWRRVVRLEFHSNDHLFFLSEHPQLLCFFEEGRPVSGGDRKLIVRAAAARLVDYIELQVSNRASEAEEKYPKAHRQALLMVLESKVARYSKTLSWFKKDGRFQVPEAFATSGMLSQFPTPQSDQNLREHAFVEALLNPGVCRKITHLKVLGERARAAYLRLNDPSYHGVERKDLMEILSIYHGRCQGETELEYVVLLHQLNRNAEPDTRGGDILATRGAQPLQQFLRLNTDITKILTQKEYSAASYNTQNTLAWAALVRLEVIAYTDSGSFDREQRKEYLLIAHMSRVSSMAHNETYCERAERMLASFQFSAGVYAEGEFDPRYQQLLEAAFIQDHSVAELTEVPKTVVDLEQYNEEMHLQASPRMRTFFVDHQVVLIIQEKLLTYIDNYEKALQPIDDKPVSLPLNITIPEEIPGLLRIAYQIFNDLDPSNPGHARARKIFSKLKKDGSYDDRYIMYEAAVHKRFCGDSQNFAVPKDWRFDGPSVITSQLTAHNYLQGSFNTRLIFVKAAICLFEGGVTSRNFANLIGVLDEASADSMWKNSFPDDVQSRLLSVVEIKEVAEALVARRTYKEYDIIGIINILEKFIEAYEQALNTSPNFPIIFDEAPKYCMLLVNRVTKYFEGLADDSAHYQRCKDLLSKLTEDGAYDDVFVVYEQAVKMKFEGKQVLFGLVTPKDVSRLGAHSVKEVASKSAVSSSLPVVNCRWNLRSRNALMESLTAQHYSQGSFRSKLILLKAAICIMEDKCDRKETPEYRNVNGACHILGIAAKDPWRIHHPPLVEERLQALLTNPEVSRVIKSQAGVQEASGLRGGQTLTVFKGAGDSRASRLIANTDEPRPFEGSVFG
jgi:hypothetical protein